MSSTLFQKIDSHHPTCKCDLLLFLWWWWRWLNPVVFLHTRLVRCHDPLCRILVTLVHVKESHTPRPDRIASHPPHSSHSHKINFFLWLIVGLFCSLAYLLALSTMRFSAASILAIFSMMMAPGFVLAEEESVPVTALIVDAAAVDAAAVDADTVVDAPVVTTAHTPEVLGGGDDDDSHNLFTVPVVFNFELDGDVSEDKRALSQIEEAIVMAGNEIFDPDYTKFFGVIVHNIVQEKIEEEEDDDDDDPGNFLTVEAPATAPAGVPTVLTKAGTRGGAAAADSKSADGLTYCNLFNCRPTRRPTPRPVPAPRSEYRLDWDFSMPYYCHLCTDGSEPSYRNRPASGRIPPRDIALSDIILEQEEKQLQGKQPLTIPQKKPLMAEDEEKENVLRWQKRTCRKIRKIKGFETAKKCFIHMDAGHSTPIDAFGNDKPYLSTFWLKEDFQPADDLPLETLPTTVTN